MNVIKVENIPRSSSRKYLIAVDKEVSAVEVAFLDFGVDRVICASAQVGCYLGCLHCATTYAPKPFIRNLTATEIIDIARFIISDANGNHPIDVIDFSGVGDCSANWDAVRDACLELFQKRLVKRYTLTSIAPRKWCEQIYQEILSQKVSPEKLVISLHGSDVATRRILIPGAEDPWEAINWWKPIKLAGCRIVLNYVLHKNNSAQEHIAALSGFVQANKTWIDTVRISPLNSVLGMSLSKARNFDVFIRKLQKLAPDVQFANFFPIGNEKKMGCGQMRAIFQNTRDTK